MMKPPSASRRRQQGVALVTTVIVVAVLAVVAVAMMQTTTVDRLSSRSVANHYRAKLAADAGLADALSRLARGVTNFNYVSGSEVSGTSYRTYIRPITSSGGVWSFSDAPVFLDSGTNGALADLLVSGTNTNNGVFVRANWTNVYTTNNETNRYAFWVDEAGAKQNLGWWAADTNARGFLTNVASLPLLLPSASGDSATPLPTAAVSALRANRTLSSATITNFANLSLATRVVSNNLLTPASLNLLDPGGLQGRASRYFFSLSSPSGAASPVGGRKLNLQQLARYLNSGVSSAQGAGSAKAVLVEELLKTNSAQRANWGGGDLGWLVDAGVYNDGERKQIVANLIDYLDADMIPTVDDTNAPTYFGVETEPDSIGLTKGHPYINFVTFGLVFNRNANGQINSSRVLCSLGLVFPWGSSNVSTANYTPEINIGVEGTVANGISVLGNQARAYFRTNDLSEQITSRPRATFAPRTGNNWPEATGLAGSASYATPFFGFSSGDWPDRGPTNMALQNARYVINKLRLRYTPTGGGSAGYVQILPTNMTISILPTNLVLGGAASPLLVKFSSGGPFANTTNLYLGGDPRAHFRSSVWTNLPSVTSFGTNIPAPSSGAASVRMTNGAGPDWDGEQGVTMNFNWFSSGALSNHFSRPTNTNGMQSIGELGYLWTGKPWQTLNMTRTSNPTRADWNILDYVAAGYAAGGSNYTVMPFVPITATGNIVTISNSLVQDGGFNIFTRKRATVLAYLTNAPGLTATATDGFAALPPPVTPSIGGALAAMTNLSVAATNKFGREAVVRALANGAVNQSRIFTVYSRGEHISGSARSSVVLEADVFVDINRQTGAPILRVLSKSFR